MIFHFREHHDKRLEISKTFIICLTNLKLAEFYFSESTFEESRNYFIKSFSKLNINTGDTKYQFRLKVTDADSIFTYLKNYILCFPLFNLSNQTNVDPSTKNLINSEESTIFKRREKSYKNIENSTNFLDACKKSIDYINRNKYLEKCQMKKEGKEEEEIIEYLNDSSTKFENDIDEINTDEEIVIEDLGYLFDIIIKNENMKKIFRTKINEIIQIIESIIYTPPYNILFGRIRINKQKPIKKEYLHQKDINELFYEGFGIEIRYD